MLSERMESLNRTLRAMKKKSKDDSNIVMSGLMMAED